MPRETSKRMQHSRVLLAIATAVIGQGCGHRGGEHSAADGGADGADVDSNAASRPSTFTFVSRTAAECPSTQTAAWCAAYWPAASEGTVYSYAIQETRVSTGAQLTRTAYVYIPVRLTGPSPALIYLHGGGSSGDALFADTKLANLADGRSVGWSPNTAGCQFKPDGSGYETSDGAACSPPPVTFANSLAFLVVFPNGVLDPGSTTNRHWEDGRVPSPGFDTTQENRDDVGFIDFLIGALETHEGAIVDQERVYVGGASNGGMMTHRLACNINAASLDELKHVAAFSASVAALPVPLSDGSDGRELCGSGGTGVAPLQMLVGRDTPTPQCVTFGCSSPTVSGDGRMPYGEAGGVYTVNSPDLGQVISFPDTEAWWSKYFARGAGSPTSTTNGVGFFTTARDYSFPDSAMRLQVFDTTGGLHRTLSTRMDFNPSGRIWEFVGSYRRSSDGSLTQSQPDYLSGTY